MTEQSTICEICGGAKSFFYEVKPDDVSQRISTRVMPKKLCYGHPKGAPKHDGKLGNEYEVCMGITQVYPSGRRKFEQGITILGCDDMICLEPKQAISLLSWLEQNRAELTALAEAENK